MANSPVDIISQNGKEIVPIAEAFPTAMVPGAKSLPDVVRGWKDQWNFVPKEMSEEDIIQRIVIEFDPRLDPITGVGKISWTPSKNMDGLGQMLVTTEAWLSMPSIIVEDALLSMIDYYLSSEGRIEIGTGQAAVIIGFEDGRLFSDSHPKDVPVPETAEKKLLVARLLYLLARAQGKPAEQIMQMVTK